MLASAARRTTPSVKNDIFLTPFGDEDEPAGSTIDGFFVNLDKTRRVGLEAGRRVHVPGGPFALRSTTPTLAPPSRATPTSSRIRSAGEEPPTIRPRPVINPFPTENEVTPGNRFPLVPDHQIKFGGLREVGRYVSVGADGRYIGKQFLRGDEANVTDPLDGYFVADARVGVEFGRWEINGIVTNLFQNESAIFGTFNINQGNPDGLTVERFLTPNCRRAFRLVVRTTLGGPTGGRVRTETTEGRFSVLSVFPSSASFSAGSGSPVPTDRASSGVRQ